MTAANASSTSVKLSPVSHVAPKGYQFDVTLCVVLGEASHQLIFMRKVPLQHEVTRLRPVKNALLLRLLDHVFEDFEVLQTVAHKQHGLVSKKGFKKGERPILAAGSSVPRSFA